MRKYWIIIAVIAFSIFAGCNSHHIDTTQTENQSYQRVTLFCDVEFWGAPLWDISEDTISGEISRETGAVIEVIDSMDDADKQLSMMLVNDNLPDLISVTDETVISQLVTSGKVWKMDEFLETYKPDSHLLTTFPEDIKYELIKRDGGWYTYPSHMSSPDNRENWPLEDYYLKETEYAWNNVIIWNKKLVQELGLHIDELQTESQVLSAFETAKHAKTNDGEDILPLLVDGQFYHDSTLGFLANTFGVEYIDEDGNYIDGYRQEEMKDALAFFNTVMRCGYASPEQFLYENNRIKTLLKEENVLCLIGNFANTGLDSTNWESLGVILPDSGKTPVYMQNLGRTTGWMNTFISKDCASPETVANLLDYMTSATGQLKWVYGTEGVHYELDSDGKIRVTEDGYQAQANYAQSGVNTWWMFFNTDWSKSVIASPDKGSIGTLNNNIACAYALNENTYIYDGTALQNLNAGYSGDAKYEQIEVEIAKWKMEQGKRVILAETKEEFEDQYQILIQGLDDRQIVNLDEKKNEEYQKNCQEYNVHIEKVNKDEETSAEDIEKTAQ